MPKRCSETFTNPEWLDARLAAIVERISRRHQEAERLLAEIKRCPGPCADGLVTLPFAAGRPCKWRCPVAGRNCAYGKALAGELRAAMFESMRAAGVPLRHLDNLAAARETAATREARSWRYRGCLVLSGSPGVGKSFAAAQTVYRRLRESVSDIFDRASWDAAAKAGRGVVWAAASEIACDRFAAGRCRTAPLVVLDDLGKEEGDAGQAAVRGVVARRYDGKLPTVVTTELSVRDIAAVYGRYIAERLTEDTPRDGRIADCGQVSLRVRHEGDGRESRQENRRTER